MNSFKPMLAADADLESLVFPVIASPKLDGIRALIKDGLVLSRSLKPIPNLHVQFLFGRSDLEGLDGELIIGSPTDPQCFQKTSGAVRRKLGEPDVTFYAFDRWNRTGPYDEAFCTDLEFQASSTYGVIPHWCQPVFTMAELLAYEQDCLDRGFEGLILRSIQGSYKFGRSTTKEGLLLKLKRFKDSEARVLAIEEQMHNANEAKTNELGLTERSSHKENLIPAGTMGRLFVEDIHTGQRFHIGTGFTKEQRDWWWSNRAELETTQPVIKYKFFPVGVKELPRHPVFLGFRDEFDLS